MLAYKIKIIDKGYVQYLPRRHSEKSYFKMTDHQSKAQAFNVEDFEYKTLDWIQECYNYDNKRQGEEELEVEIITTLATEKEEEELRDADYER